MPLGIVKDEDYERDLRKKDIPKQEDASGQNDEDSRETPSESDNNDVRLESVAELEEFTSRGRGQGSTEVPTSIRKIIGESAIEEGRSAAQAIGKFLGLSNSSVAAYSKGATSTASYNKPEHELLDHLDKTRKKITKRAQGKLFKALNVISEDKLNDLSALEASTVAKNMAAIVKSMEPEQKHGPTINGPVITFYAPHLVQEEKFDVINVNE